MNISKKKIYLIIISILVVAIIVPIALIINNSEYKSVSEEDKISNNIEEYPSNLLEGIVISVDSSGFLIRADISKIENMGEKKEIEIYIKATEETEVITYDLVTQKEEVISFEDIKIDDGVVVSAQEKNKDILTREFFTAIKVTKILTVPELIQ